VNDDLLFMKLAIEEAKKAEAIKEVPIGALIVKDGKIIAAAYNLRERDQRAVAHAELLAIDEACKKLNTWRLTGCTLYVTLEPCPMCAGAIIQSRVERVVFGASDPKAGCVGSIYNLLTEPKFNHQCEIVEGIMAKECGELLTSFFRDLRKKKAKNSLE
jgi:tRNA(adenine34) deaminase